MGNKKPNLNLNMLDVPVSRGPVSLLSVDRAISEVRRGRIVAIRGANGTAAIAQATESLDEESFQTLSTISGKSPALTITARRAIVLGLSKPEGKSVTLVTNPPLNIEAALAIADPLTKFEISKMQITSRVAQTYDSESAAVTLAKLARLLPSALTAVIPSHDGEDLTNWALRHNVVLVDAGDIFQYERMAARSLKIVSEAHVPLANAEDARIIAFRPQDGGIEHLAIIIGSPTPDTPVLTRIHSECFTGDLLGSLRCDCGEQLRGAITEISVNGDGILLYLAQEGRGIGLANKLRAYALQDTGFDTIDANEQLGFDADERVFLPAARMLQILGFSRVNLMTNNPQKVSGLQACGVEVETRIPHKFPSNKHNESYLRTKSTRGGHIF